MHTRTIYMYMGHMHAGMENQYMPDQYQNIATLYILNQECMMLIIEKSNNDSGGM